MIERITNQLAILGHPQRILVFRMLIRRFPDSVPAGELADELDLKASTLSNYLNALQRSGLVKQERSGTSLLYSVEMNNVQQMLDYLIVDCCRGRPDICMPFAQGSETVKNRKFNVLFLCVGNSARSIFAESLLRQLGGDRFNVYSAGTQPTSQLNPFALQVLSDKGHDTSILRSKHMSEFAAPDAPEMDFVFTVCNQAANEECPAWEGQPISGHWGMPDPVNATGTDAEKSLAFQNAYGALKRRIEAFTSLPVESLDGIALQSAVDDIGRTPTEDIK
ncbi:arsenate reductase/protein-tyrosine-phosphatase family protein [Ruegeria atlantica]|uniref:Arsenate reductase n=1 Tax=Ruegeria atlantica TaxID=81569 RepID=A0A0P1EI74_9RHOB|nr:helix-turn-helix domain-containing protein [Ruegeria atlantica]CUH49809.1 Arsenate reductase [Ruegeria atlantica]